MKLLNGSILKELSSYNAVPNLLETFYRVYLPNNVHLGLIDMLTDRSSSAQKLINKALDIFSETIENKLCHEYSQCSKDLYINYLNIGWHLCEIRSNMKPSTLYIIISIKQQCKKSLDQILSIDSFDNQVFTFKNLECSRTLTITILESRPLNEGAILEQKLLSMLNKMNISIQIITDSSYEYDEEENDSSEITKIYGDQWKDHKNLLVRNVYFEKLESDQIVGYVTEVNSKLLMPKDIQKLWNERKSLESKF
ncbi:nagb/rpia/CoA transferase-like protein [Gigaspora margarita]|uniref:Nagb/rpia/CoA transferase-like protein n=1 Tax=Gigaspora margarita TaxID=4874 RepID=A0A8H3X1W2_GIGMA|nr:nagb/rpia/CoA transferase-like protein [Gigaspora margarita]